MKAALSSGALSVLLLVGAAAQAVPPFELPGAARAARYERGEDRLTVAAVGAPDASLRRMSAARASARRAAAHAAAASLHRFVDDAMARVRARPRIAAAVHAALERARRTVGSRPLVDGGAVTLMEAPAGPLRDAAPLSGVPWAR